MLAVASYFSRSTRRSSAKSTGAYRDLYRLLTWIVVLCLTVVLESLAGKPVSNVSAGGWLAPLITVAIMTPFFWWTMHFLVAGRVPWRKLPSAITTGVCFRRFLREGLFLRNDHLGQQDVRNDRSSLRRHDLAYSNRSGDHPGSRGPCRLGRPEDLTDPGAMTRP